MQRLRHGWGAGSLARQRDALAGYAVTVLAVAAASVVLAPLRSRLGPLSIGLLYLLIAVLIAARWGWGPGLFASVVAYVAFDFFIVPPLRRLMAGEPADILALLVYLGVTALTSALLARARAGEAAARRREQEATILYDLSRLIIGDLDLASTLAAISSRVQETFAAESCDVLLPGDGGGAAPAAGAASALPVVTADERDAVEQALISGRTVALGARPGRRGPRIVGVSGRRGPLMFVPLRVGGRVNGVLRVAGALRPPEFTGDDQRLLEAFAHQAALAVDRDRLLREAARAEALQEADRLKTALLAAVSHDLRTPLASIKASASSLLETAVQWDGEARAELLTGIDEETDRLTRLVSNLLDLSRIEGGALRPEQDWYDVRELVETTGGRLGRVAARHRLVIDVAPDTGEALLDYVQIGQVLTNLVENAAKFAPEGSEIRITACRRGESVELGVSDRGPGIPPAERERVFDKFHRTPAVAGRVAGTGLGLAISKGLVEAHGGGIRVEDAPGGGARFVVSIPAPPAPLPPPDTAAGERRRPARRAPDRSREGMGLL